MIKIIETANKYQLLPFLMTIFVYFAELYLFLLDYISSFFFWTILVLHVILWPLFLFWIRKTHISKRVFLFSFIASLFLMSYEYPIMFTLDNHYLVSSYVPPEELIKESGIYLLAVTTSEIKQKEVLDEKAFRDLYSHQIILDIKQASNFDLYEGKTIATLKFFGINLDNDYFQQMSVNVKTYLKNTSSTVDDFLARSNAGGNSAGLALVLSSLIEQEKLKNNQLIGVTGAISKTGETIEIIQVEEKILSAHKIDLSYIILPMGNLEEGNDVVKSFNLPIEVIGVKSVDDAIQKINELNEEK